MSTDLDIIRKNLTKEELEHALKETFKNSNTNIEISDKTYIEIAKYIAKVRRGSSSFIELICLGAECMFANICPFMAKDSGLPNPLGVACPLDTISAKRLYEDYIEDLQIDIRSRTECSQVNDLVEIDILKNRISAILGREGIIEEAIVGIDPNDGTPLQRKEVHPALIAKETLDRRRASLLRQLQATREARVNANKQLNDPSNIYAKITQILQEHDIHSNIINADIVKEEAYEEIRRSEKNSNSD